MASSSSAPDLHPAEVAPINPRVTIDDLSNEILINIIRFLPADQPLKYYKALGPLLVCSKRIHTLTEQILYSQFIEEWGAHPQALQLFLKRMLARPDLARQVKSYHGMASDNQDHDNYLDITCFNDEDWVDIKNRVAELSHDETESSEWVDSIRQGNWEAITALTLSLTPNIQNLEFEGWSYTNEVYPILLRFLSRARTLQVLCHVTRVRQDYWDTENGLSIDQLIPLLSLPSVEVFWGQMIEDRGYYSNDEGEEEEPKWMRLNPTFPKIKELSLYHVDIAPGVLEKFLKFFPNLEKFSYVSGYAGYEPFEPPRMMAALEHLKLCLKTLSVSNENNVGAGGLEDHPIGFLRGFEKLTDIELDSSMLTGCDYETEAREGFLPRQDVLDALPISIESITLHGCDYNKLIPQQISSLLSHKHIRFPALKKIDIDWEMIKYPDKPSPSEPFKHPSFSKEEALNLLVEFENAGVEMVMKTLPPQPKHIYYTKKLEGEDKMNSLGHFVIPTTVSHMVNYPYEEYEKICEENGCDPETGRPPGQMC